MLAVLCEFFLDLFCEYLMSVGRINGFSLVRESKIHRQFGKGVAHFHAS